MQVLGSGCIKHCMVVISLKFPQGPMFPLMLPLFFTLRIKLGENLAQKATIKDPKGDLLCNQPVFSRNQPDRLFLKTTLEQLYQ